VRLISYAVLVLAVAPIIPLVLETTMWLTGESILPGLTFFVASVFAAACLFVAIHLLKRHIDQLLEGTILREDYRGRSRLRHLAQRIASISDEEEMFLEVVESTQNTLDTAGAAIAVRGELEAEISPVVAIGFPEGFEMTFRLSDDDPLVRLIQRSRKAIVLEEIEMDETIEQLRNEFLDTYHAWMKTEDPKLKRKLEEQAELLREVDPTFEFTPPA